MRFAHTAAPAPVLDIALPVVAAAAGGAYAWGVWRARKGGAAWPPGRAASFFAGLGVLLAAEAASLRALAELRLSAHMVQHLLLLQLAPPLLWLGRPVQLALVAVPRTASSQLLRRTVVRPWVHRLVEWLGRPAVAFALFSGTLVLWHLPAAYVAAVESPALHAAEHAMFLGSALLWWRVLVDPVPRHHRAGVHDAFLLVFATGAVGDVIGATITLAPDVLYPVYAERAALAGADALADQRVAGLVMWLGGALYFALLFWLVVRSARRSAERRAVSG
jgi:cytochrome c oxidase assembly factor CtaG